jgi:hypothetical protein
LITEIVLIKHVFSQKVFNLMVENKQLFHFVLHTTHLIVLHSSIDCILIKNFQNTLLKLNI